MRRNYPLLLGGQFLGAFGDNAILAVIVGQLTYLQLAGTISAEQLRIASSVYTGILFVPYVLLAPVAGFLNDRYSKTAWLAGGNFLKLCGTAICLLGATDTVLLGVGYFLVGIGACVYGPAKYGILPEILPREGLVRANGTVELLTLLAILTGAIGGSKLADVFKDSPATSFAIVAAIFVAAWSCALLMKRTPSNAAITFRDSWGAFSGHLRALAGHRRIARVLAGTALFWWCGATMKMNFQPWGLDVLGLKNNLSIALLGLWLSVGVMAGSLLAGRLHAVGDLRWTRRYGAALAVVLAVLGFVTPTSFWLEPTYTPFGLSIPVPVVAVLAATGVAAGLFLIPLNAALQAETDPGKLGKTIAVQNLFDNLGMCGAFGFVFTLAHAGVSSSGVFIALACGVVAALFWFRRAALAPMEGGK
ncbi:MFS transporter [Nibricoccus sp. IMCC34717]|uniref:MFS transporter n=1 Tax=Nibricoccus sp. IMCC34717 TaxID=3034021 RepID=UPI00384DA9EC